MKTLYGTCTIAEGSEKEYSTPELKKAVEIILKEWCTKQNEIESEICPVLDTLDDLFDTPEQSALRARLTAEAKRQGYDFDTPHFFKTPSGSVWFAPLDETVVELDDDDGFTVEKKQVFVSLGLEGIQKFRKL